MDRIRFERIVPNVSYTHFVEMDGSIIAMASLHNLRNPVVGVVFGQEFPTDLQRQSIAHLANLATGVDPTVEVVFAEGCSPFPGAMVSQNPFVQDAI